MIAAATKRNPAFISAGLAKFALATAESCNLDRERFNKVLAMRVRFFHDQPAEARRLAERWLARNGKLFVQYDEPGNDN